MDALPDARVGPFSVEHEDYDVIRRIVRTGPCIDRHLRFQQVKRRVFRFSALKCVRRAA